VSASDPVLLATTIFVRQEDGTRKQYHRGEAVPGLNDEQVDRLTKCGALGTSDDLEPEVVETDDGIERNGMGVPVGDGDDAEPVDDADAADDDGVEKPAKIANKATLVAWLVDNAAKDDGSDFTATELNQKNKDELWELIDGIE
jgi:hypothetical protein